MTRRDDSAVTQWDLIRAFLALERHGDYAIATEAEGIDDSTLRRRIRALEEHMGRTLFVRLGRGWKAAADQHELVRAALSMEEAARRFSRTHQDGAGVIRVSVLDAFAQRLTGVFSDFQQRHPRLRLNVTTEIHFVDLEQEQVDIAIRLARPTHAPNSLRIRKLGNVPVNAFASRDYLAWMAREHEDGRSPGHRVLAMSLAFSHGDHNFAFSELDVADFGLSGEVVTWSDSFPVLARLCELGRGIALLPSALARDHPGLVPVSDKQAEIQAELWMISRFDLRAAWQQDLAQLLQTELAGWKP